MPPFAEAVIDLVDRIPQGKVLSYGDVAALVGGGGPRQVGAGDGDLRRGDVVVARHPSDGRAGARPRDRAARTPSRRRRALVGGRRVDMRRARWTGAG